MTIMRIAAAAVLAMAVPASAGVQFSNLHSNTGIGNCSFNTTCAQAIGRPGIFAGQKFTLEHAVKLTSASFTALVETGPGIVTSVNWQLLFVDLNTGLPGTLIASGNSAITNRILNVRQLGGRSGPVFDYHYGLPKVGLSAGDYFLGFQAVSSEFDVYLLESVENSGAVTFNDFASDGWTAGYSGSGIGGVAISVSAPEPTSWAMLIIGFGLVGASLRRRRAMVA